MRALLPLLLVIAASVSGCASYPHNAKLEHYDPRGGYRYDNLQDPANSESLFVILTFSGGGTRAAALSHGVLEKLRNTPIVWEGRRGNLLAEVDLISSVSGGSFTAAYYAAFGDDIFNDQNTAGYLRDFLYRDIEDELFTRLFYPGNWLRLASPYYSRIDMAASFYDEEIFRAVRYADLLRRKQKPYLMINATDMSLGSRFTFEQAQFDPMCADLAEIPLARAVAASSNFPVAFPPMTLDNHAGGCDYERQPPGWIEQAEKDLLVNPSRYKAAVSYKTYQDRANRPYIHLLDGGIADNLGLRGPLQAMVSNDTPLNLPMKISGGKIKKVLIITVDAKNQPDLNYDASPAAPSVVEVLKTVANVPMDNFSFETTEALRNAINALIKDKNTYLDCQAVLKQQCANAEMPTPPPRLPQLEFVYVGFELLSNPVEREKFFHMPTTFTLPGSDIDDLRDVGKRLLGDSRAYRNFVEALR